MAADIHGTKSDPTKHHPVLDIRHWESEFPLGDHRREGGCIDDAPGLARREQAIRLVRGTGELGPAIPTDVFVWSHHADRARPWLTRIGGKPWRENNKPWPKNAEGVPLHFLGQICFADSKDIVPYELPGEIALIFGRWQHGWATIVEGSALEWSNIELDEPLSSTPGYTSRLPFERHGIIHRTVQYIDRDTAEAAFVAAGWKKGGWGVRSTQATLIGTYADLPQGWPFEESDGCTLIAILSSSYFHGKWPMVDIPRTLIEVDRHGAESEMMFLNALDFGVGDAGAIWIYRDGQGSFHINAAC